MYTSTRYTSPLDIPPPELGARIAAIAASGVHIAVRVSYLNTHFYFKMKTNVKLGKLKKAFCERSNLPKDGVCFKYNGRCVKDCHSPERLAIQHDDQIVVSLRKSYIKILQKENELKQLVKQFA